MRQSVISNLGLWITLSLLFAPVAAVADSGFYVGGSVGAAAVEARLGDSGIPGFPASLDEDDTAYKIFGGYRFDLPAFYVAVEADYVDFGKPEVNILGESFSVDPTAFNVWGLAALEVGPVDLFGKLGFTSWEVSLSALENRSKDDGYDIAIGAGISVGLGPVSVRGEYEVYNIDRADVSMLSVGVVYLFD